jgi:hypothetical protein
MPPLPFQNQALGVSPEALNKYWEQFQLSGFPNGTVDGTYAFVGIRQILTSAQLLALQTTAVQLVAPPVTSLLGNAVPPAGFVYVPTSLRAEYKFGATAYTIGNADNNFQIEYTGKTTALLNLTVTGLVDQTASTFALAQTTTSSAKIALANCANLGLEVKLAGTTPALTLGDGTVHLSLTYNIVPLF